MTLDEINQQSQDAHGEEEIDTRTHVISVDLFR